MLSFSWQVCMSPWSPAGWTPGHGTGTSTAWVHSQIPAAAANGDTLKATCVCVKSLWRSGFIFGNTLIHESTWSYVVMWKNDAQRVWPTDTFRADERVDFQHSPLEGAVLQLSMNLRVAVREATSFSELEEHLLNTLRHEVTVKPNDCTSKEIKTDWTGLNMSKTRLAGHARTTHNKPISKAHARTRE